MYLRELTITNYRNIEAASLSFSPFINCFAGDNGMGKTNVLDAIYFLSICRGHSAMPTTSVTGLRVLSLKETMSLTTAGSTTSFAATNKAGGKPSKRTARMSRNCLRTSGRFRW